MGEKGARLTGTAVEVAETLVEELTPLGDITSKKMFGGVGIFGEANMFVIVDSQGTVYLKADAAMAEEFEAAGGEKHGRMPYWSIPEKVLADPDALLDWARRSMGLAKS